jgi:ketosteroid isomerase-like protein
MSKENVEMVRRQYDAFSRGDHDAAIAMLHPEFEWRGPREFPDLAEPHYGHAGVRRYLAKLAEAFTDYRMVGEQFIDVDDDRVLVFAREGGRGMGSGIEVQTNPTGHVWTFRDGKPASLQSYWERADARRAVGLAE